MINLLSPQMVFSVRERINQPNDQISLYLKAMYPHELLGIPRVTLEQAIQVIKDSEPRQCVEEAPKRSISIRR